MRQAGHVDAVVMCIYAVYTRSSKRMYQNIQERMEKICLPKPLLQFRFWISNSSGLCQA